jgi:hypothetical protein
MNKKLCVLLVAVLFIAGCSQSPHKSSTNGPRPVTNAEAQLLARVLSNNLADKTASFNAASGTLPNDGFVAQGKVDWKNSRIKIDVALSVATQIDISSISTADKVFESVTGLADAETDNGMISRDWITRTLDPQKYGIDALSQFIVKLSSQSADNPILIKQSGATFQGNENIKGVTTKKFRYGSLTYWLDKKGTMVQTSAQIKGFTHETTIYFYDRTQAQVDVPSESESYPIDQVGQFYTSLRPAF